MSRAGNRNRAKFTFKFYEHDSENRLDVLYEFIDWTKVRNLKSYIEISKMLHTTPNEANRLLNLAVLPDDRIVKRMKEVMHESKRV
ncbi:hypothetical protein KJW53_07180 [Streptococcus macedonicus]|uniref:hypothetical protein n=1 Tax=Streptococcus macedonicus TaxID=59310 RepID=UPI001BDC75A7|nr:hypothetical protein [Streptococcus macedonicus]MBT1048570.1 hypothetical protein [Streptococcus macedonicus]